jgi:hypothetical protein
MKTLREFDWVLSALGAIVISVVANMLTPAVKDWTAHWSSRRSAHRVEELRSELRKAERLRADPALLTATFATRLFDFLTDMTIAAISGLGTVVGVATAEPGTVSGIATGVISILALLCFTVGFIRGMLSIRLFKRVQNLEDFRRSVERRIAKLGGSHKPAAAVIKS